MTMGDRATPSKRDANPPMDEYPSRPWAAFLVCTSIGAEGAGASKARGNDDAVVGPVDPPPSEGTNVGKGLAVGDEDVVGATVGPGDVVGDGVVGGADAVGAPSPQSNDVPADARNSA
jgi:hypothetical protein